MRARAGVGVLLVVVMAACSGSDRSTAAGEAGKNDTPDLFVSLNANLPTSSVATVKRQVRRLEHVERLEYMSPADARDMFIDQLPRKQRPRTATELQTVPIRVFPATLQVRLDYHSQRNAIARRVRRLDGVDQVYKSPTCSHVRRIFARMFHLDHIKPADRRWVKLQQRRALKHGCVEA